MESRPRAESRDLHFKDVLAFPRRKRPCIHAEETRRAADGAETGESAVQPRLVVVGGRGAEHHGVPRMGRKATLERKKGVKGFRFAFGPDR